MKFTLFALFNLLLISTFAQTTNFIEIAVNELVELKPKTVTLHIAVESEDQQRSRLYREVFGRDEDDYEYEYEYEDYSDEEEDWMYEELMEENPKKVTKEMKEAYEERARQREEREKLEQQREAEFEKKWKNYQKITVNDVQAKIKGLKLESKIIKHQTGNLYESLSNIYDDDYDETPDSVVSIILTNSKDWERLNEAIISMSTEQSVQDITFETVDDQYPTIIPKLTQKAQVQAGILATSMNRKLGKIVGCTNVYPATPSKTFMSSYSRQLERMMENRSEGDNPFESTKEEVIEYIYKFEMLN